MCVCREREREYPPLLSYGDQLACCFVMVNGNGTGEQRYDEQEEEEKLAS